MAMAGMYSEPAIFIEVATGSNVRKRGDVGLITIVSTGLG